MKRLLLVTRLEVVAAHHGGCAYPAGIVDALRARGWRVDVAWIGAPLVPATRWRGRLAPGERLRVPGAAVVGDRVVSRSPACWAEAVARRLLPGKRWSPRASPDPAPLLRGLGAAGGHDAWLVGETRLAPLLRLRGRAVGAVLTHEVLADRAASFRAGGVEPDFKAMDPADELRCWGEADTLVAISEEDGSRIRALLPGPRPGVVVVPPAPPAAPPQDPALREPGRVLFVGSANAANVDGLRWFLAACWPGILRRVPGATLVVAGYAGRAIDPDTPGVRLLDHVDDLVALHARASVVVAPLRVGSGLKLKSWEAVHLGRPLVATPEAVRGWATWRDAVAVAGDAAGFGAAVERLLADPVAWDEARARQLAWVDPARFAGGVDALDAALRGAGSPGRVGRDG